MIFNLQVRLTPGSQSALGARRRHWATDPKATQPLVDIPEESMVPACPTGQQGSSSIHSLQLERALTACALQVIGPAPSFSFNMQQLKPKLLTSQALNTDFSTMPPSTANCHSSNIVRREHSKELFPPFHI